MGLRALYHAMWHIEPNIQLRMSTWACRRIPVVGRFVTMWIDRTLLGGNRVVGGTIDMCDNMVIGMTSLVDKSIDEPGVYAGVPARKIRDEVPGDEWVAHLARPSGIEA